MEEEKMVPWTTAMRMFNTGMEWEAGLFIETYRELIKRMPKEEARDILGKAMYRAGYRLGVEARNFTTKKGPLGFAEVRDVIYGAGSTGTVLQSKDRCVYRTESCACYNLMKRWDPEEVDFLGEVYCSGDVGQARGFDEEMFFQHTYRLAAGDDFCEFEYATTEQEKAKSADPVEELGLDK
jgi:hypothetical protein